MIIFVAHIFACVWIGAATMISTTLSGFEVKFTNFDKFYHKTIKFLKNYKIRATG